MTGAMAAWQDQSSRGGQAAWSGGPPPVNANVPWAADYGREIKAIIHRQADRAPRSNQVHLGPSELGIECSHQVVGKMIAEPRTNHVSDSWPAIVGTAVHTWLATALEDENARIGVQRFLAELRVAPVPEHPGTTDLFDTVTGIVGDWKALGPTSMAKVSSPAGPSRKYKVQLLLYWLGCLLAGYPARRIALIALPRTAPTLDGMYVWGCEPGPEEIALLQEVLRVTAVRRQIAAEILKGNMRLADVPITPDNDECFVCLGGETEIVTRNGIRPIRELAGSAHELAVPVLGSKGALKSMGSFKTAEVRALGEQQLYEVRLRKRRSVKIVRATAEHRWFLTAGRQWEQQDAYERTTSQLQPGNQLRSLRIRTSVRAEIMPVAIAQGFTFGDGTIGQGRRPATLVIYDNGKDESLLPYFPLVQPTSYPAYGENGPMKLIYGLPRFWKQLPPLEESRTFLLSWLAGYFAADGDVTKAGQPTLWSASEEAIRFARDIAAICGIGYSPIRSKWRLGKGTMPTELWSLNLRRRNLPDWFFTITEHRLRAAAANKKPGYDSCWTVESVTATSQVEEVYCAVVPGAGAFGLADDLMTGNCPFWRPQAAHDGGPGCPGKTLAN